MSLTLNEFRRTNCTSDYVNKLYIRIYRECGLAFVFIEQHQFFYTLFMTIPTLTIYGMTKYFATYINYSKNGLFGSLIY